MDLQDIGQRIRDTRRDGKLTQAALASQLGMSRATISGIERGTVPDIGVRKLTGIFHCCGRDAVPVWSWRA